MSNLSQFFHGHPRKLGCEMRSLIPYIFGGWRLHLQNPDEQAMWMCASSRLSKPRANGGLENVYKAPSPILLSGTECTLGGPSAPDPSTGARETDRESWTGTTGTRVDAPAQVIARGKPGTALVKASTLVIRERHQWLGTALTARTRARRPQRRSRARVSLCQKVPP